MEDAGNDSVNGPHQPVVYRIRLRSPDFTETHSFLGEVADICIQEEVQLVLLPGFGFSGARLEECRSQVSNVSGLLDESSIELTDTSTCGIERYHLSLKFASRLHRWSDSYAE